MKEWYGGGELSVHSSVSAPSHGLSAAGAPRRMHWTTLYRNSSWLTPSMKPPMLEIMLKSANCSA
jgi:hypothetical protein